MKNVTVLSLLALCLGLLAPVARPPGAAESVDGNTLTIALLKEPATLDAQRIFIAVEGDIVTDMGATLVAADPETGEPVPYLATDWAVSADGLLWTFHLRDDVWFHDGTPFTAEEYVWTIQRILSLTGPESFVPQALLSSVAEARAVDPYTLELQLRSPDATLIYNLASEYLQPLSPQAVERAGDDYGRQPVGVGPFRFKAWVPGQKIVLERNPDFTWGPSFTSGGPAKIDQIEYTIIPNYDLALVDLLEGRIDVLKVEHGDARQVLDQGDFILLTVQAGQSLFLMLDVTQPPLDDLRVRQALNYAVNRDQLISIVEYGYGQPQYGPVAPVTMGAWPGAEEAGYHTDLAQARSLLAEAGYDPNAEGLLVKDGEMLALTILVPLYSALPQLPQVVDILSDQFRQVGIEVKAILLDANAVLPETVDPATYDVTVEAITWPETTFILLNIILSSGQSNLGHVNDPELDRLLLGSLTSVDLDAGRQLLWDAQQRIIENAYLVPLYSPYALYAINQRVKNYQDSGHTRWLIDASIK